MGERPVPFLYLDPRFAGTPGGAWWQGKLWPLLAAGIERSVLARNILCVEWFPYHSRHFKPRRSELPSQAYGFGLVASAVARGALVIAMRSVRLWERAVPALAGYPRLATLRSAQNVIVSRANYGADFDELVAVAGE